MQHDPLSAILDTGLECLVFIARFHNIRFPSNPSGTNIPRAGILWTALKSCVQTSQLN